MSRLDRPTQKSSNPATKFLQWKSNEKTFAYYDKSKEENVMVELPLKLIFLEHYHTVKGWNDKTESGIYSNEVYAIGLEELIVKSFKGGEIASGFYKEIKPKVKDAGGVYHRSIYCMDENGDIVNLSIKGSAVSSYSEFYNDNRNHIENDSWFVVSGAKDGKKGSVKFSTPVFEIGDRTTKKEEALISKAVERLQEYMTQYIDDQFKDRAKSAVNAYEVRDAEEVIDELEF
jgi:hypothetical protein